MSAASILLAVVAGLVVNEFCELSPWGARKLVRWAAFLQYKDPDRARVRAEELSALIDDRPGKLFKLCTALGFALAAMSRAAGHLATGPAVRFREAVEFLDYESDRYDHDQHEWRLGQMQQAWKEIVQALNTADGHTGTAFLRRRLIRLRETTGDPQWDVLAEKVLRLRHPWRHYDQPGKGATGLAGGPYYGGAGNTPTQATVDAYLDAARRVRKEIVTITDRTHGDGDVPQDDSTDTAPTDGTGVQNAGQAPQVPGR